MASAVETLIRNTVSKGVLKVAKFNAARAPSPSEPHPFMTGIHRRMEEEFTLTDLRVDGQIPPELDGQYLRIGPNPVVPANPAVYHWFTGDGMVHGIQLEDGKALSYRNRWIRSNTVTDVLGGAPTPGPRNGPRDVVNTNILSHAGKIWGLVESGTYPVEMTEDLGTVAYNPFEGTLKGSFSAHPHLDPETGEMHAICYDATQPKLIRHVVVGRDGKVRREEPISVADGPSIHDCMITKNYVLIFDLPVNFSMKLLLAGQNFPYSWNPNHQARVGLLPREGRAEDIIWCNVSPCYVFHPCNGYETEDGKVIVDVAAHATMFTESTQGPDSHGTPFERWTIDPTIRSVDRAVIDPDAQEFPRLNEAYLGKPYRYAYTMALPESGAVTAFSANKLYKHDLVAKSRQVHSFGPDRFPGEFVFVPKANSTAEDDGWLMGFVINLADETTDFVILDAANFEGAPQASVHIPHRIPPGFHGNWVVASR
jgi:8'-apo-carotenoid 13,14-cleaving dioxygenase